MRSGEPRGQQPVAHPEQVLGPKMSEPRANVCSDDRATKFGGAEPNVGGAKELHFLSGCRFCSLGATRRKQVFKATMRRWRFSFVVCEVAGSYQMRLD